MAKGPDKPRAEPGAPAKAPKPKPTRRPGSAGSASRAKAPATRAVGAAPRLGPRVQWPLRLTAIAALVTLVLDQASKWLVVQWMDLATRREIDVLDPWLNFRMAWNQGVNFGLFSSSVEVMRWVLIAIAVAVCLWVGAWVQRSRPTRFARIAAGLLIGGALGNVIDRLAYGAVADFLNMSLPGWTNPYSFNVADIAIFAGALGLVFQPHQPPLGADKGRDDAAKTR